LVKLNIPRIYGHFVIESIRFAPAFKGNTFVAAITTFAGKMHINFIFSEPSISYETADFLANNVISGITEVCQREDVYFLELPK